MAEVDASAAAAMAALDGNIATASTEVEGGTAVAMVEHWSWTEALRSETTHENLCQVVGLTSMIKDA